MTLPKTDELSIARQAAEWFTALENGGAAERAAFSEWILQSPLHVKEFLNISAVHRMFDGMDPQKRIGTEQLTAPVAENVIPWARPAAAVGGNAKTLRSRMRWPVAVAAGVAALAIGGLIWFNSGWDSYATAVGEQRAIKLPDGSQVSLSAHSSIRVRFDGKTRDIRLMQGEALFTVTHDPRQPFNVHAGAAVIRVLGTQFNVSRRTRDTVVAVIDGMVQVANPETEQLPARLKAGQETRINASGRIAQLTTADTTKVTAWQQRRLVFESDTLEDIAAQFNRYNRASKIFIEGDAVRQRRFTGVLNADNPESLLDLLTEADDLTFERDDGKLVIRVK